MDRPYEARSHNWVGFPPKDHAGHAHVLVYCQAGDDYAALVLAGKAPDCRVCQETFQGMRACVGPVRVEAFLQHVQPYHDGAHRSGGFAAAEREPDLRPAIEADLRARSAVDAVKAEAIIGTDLRTNGCKACGTGSGTGYCGDHQPDEDQETAAAERHADDLAEGAAADADPLEG